MNKPTNENHLNNNSLREIFEEESAADIVVSNLLPEAIGSVEPSDLKNRILQRLSETETDSSTHDAAVRFAENEIRDGYGLVVPPPVFVEETSDANLAKWVQRGVASVLVLAATLLVVLLSPSAFESWAGKNKISQDDRPKLPQLDKNQSPKIADSDAARTKESNGTNETKSIETPRTRAIPPSSIAGVDDAVPGDLESNELAATDRTPQNNGLNLRETPKGIGESLDGSRLSDGEIVGIVDDQLRHLWKRVGISPEPQVKPDNWLDRATLATIGRLPTAAEREAFRSHKKEDRQSIHVQRLVASEEFARHWSKLMAEHYLGRSVLPKRDQSAKESAFVGWLESAIAKRTFIGTIEQELVATGSPDSEAAYWLAEIFEGSERNQRDSADPLDVLQKPENKMAGVVGIARQLMRISGNSAMACSQCHVEEAGETGVQSYLANASNLRSSDSFWSVPASVSSVSVGYQNNQRILKIGSPKEFFFEDADGRMKLANAGPPSLNHERKELGDWYLSSEEPRRAIVEMAWTNIFRQPLVPAFGLSEDEGLNERKDLRDLLANQLQSGQSDLGAIVSWLVLSNAFQLERVSTDAPWYLKANEGQIASKQNQIRLFAGFPTYDAKVLSDRNISMERIASWSESNVSFRASEAALAQGAVERLPNGNPNNAKSSKQDYTEEQVRYFISVSNPYSELDLLARSLAKSSMSLPKLLDHAFLVSDARFPSKGEREQASRIYEAANKDRAKTVVMLINARLGNW